MNIKRFLVLRLCLAAPMVQADVCNDLNAIANGWNDIAIALERDAGEGIESLDVD